MKRLTLLLSALVMCASASARIWHVSPSGSDTNDGTAASPVRTISKAAFYAIAGDTVLIQQGVYRERVSPANTGFNDRRRVTYMAAPDEEVWIKGSEIVKGWKKDPKVKGVWSTQVPNSLFGDFNPFAIEVYGDWLLEGKGMHLGEVYINGESLQEYLAEGDLSAENMSWFASVDDDVTTIKANFGDQDPTRAIVEINVRPTCFFPQTTGISYITVKGIKIAQAATQWSPPTGEQVGIIGPNWSKGWIIEDCEIMQSKCVGICIGKDRASGHNFSSLYKGTDHSKMGFTREIEAIFKAYELGWTYDNIGSHLIQNNKIHDCNQAGIVGHLGCIFTTIRNNEIYNINVDTPIGGHETGGIKLHGGIDVIIENNVITNTRRGVWIDWQAQGMHVRNNVFEDNISEDVFVEVTHGPTLVYNNIMLSDRSLLLRAQGTAFFNNIIGGAVNAGSSAAGRYTPYHQPHSTAIKGLHNNPGGDWHFYNNIFLAQADGEVDGKMGLDGCSEYPASLEEYKANSNSGHEAMGVLTNKFPIYMDANIYFGSNSAPHRNETGYTRQADKEITVTLEKRTDGHYYISTNLDASMLKGVKTLPINTAMLGEVIIPELLYENPDGTEFSLTTDYFGKARNASAPQVGPFEGAINTTNSVF
ncbi:MAG: right-handed parallel beta-helix repeat-containing protein [Rikenellaceae bacterium]